MPTLFGLFFDDLHSQLQSDCPSAGVECRGTRIPSLFYADDVALLSASAQGLQQLLDSMQSFCVANGLTISIPKKRLWSLVGDTMTAPGRWLVNI